jgi:hypothetical protein
MAQQEYRILASGYRSSIALLSFSPSDASIKVVSESPAPPSASWLEFDPHGQSADGSKGKGLYTISRPNRDPDQQVVYTISEDEEKGLGVSAVLKGDKVEITGQRGTRGAPAHRKSRRACVRRSECRRVRGRRVRGRRVRGRRVRGRRVRGHVMVGRF